jgi:hypothetical protein
VPRRGRPRSRPRARESPCHPGGRSVADSSPTRFREVGVARFAPAPCREGAAGDAVRQPCHQQRRDRARENIRARPYGHGGCVACPHPSTSHFSARAMPDALSSNWTDSCSLGISEASGARDITLKRRWSRTRRLGRIAAAMSGTRRLARTSTYDDAGACAQEHSKSTSPTSQARRVGTSGWRLDPPLANRSDRTAESTNENADKERPALGLRSGRDPRPGDPAVPSRLSVNRRQTTNPTPATRPRGRRQDGRRTPRRSRPEPPPGCAP